MADIFFPDGTKLSDLAPNTANLLASPTFSGFSTNPGTAADIVNELTTGYLSTPGVIPTSTTCYVTFNIGSSKRFVLYSKSSVSSSAVIHGIELSDDGSVWSPQVSTTGILAQFAIAGKAGHIRIKLYQSTGVDQIIDWLSMRAYKL